MRKGWKIVERMTIPDVRIDQNTIRRSIIDSEKVKECAMEIYWRLKAIEDVVADGDTKKYDLERMWELIEADRDGRCAILSVPMKPMVQKPNDTDVYCPRCGETLSGGWPCPDYEDYRRMCQCPNCGESIDDNKVELLENDMKGDQHE